MRIHCIMTDDYYDDTEWPTSTCCTPVLGDSVQSLCKNYLYDIIAIVHCISDTGEAYLSLHLGKESYED